MISSSWTSQPCLLRSCRVWSLCVNKQRNKVLAHCTLSLERWSHVSFSSCLEGARWAQCLSGTGALSRVESLCGTLGSDLLQGTGWCVGCCRSWLEYIEFPQLFIYIALSSDVLCCSFVYLEVHLRSRAFSPKGLVLVLKVVEQSGLCSFPESVSCCPGNSWELWGVRGSCFCWFSKLQQCITALLWFVLRTSCRSSGLSLALAEDKEA